MDVMRVLHGAAAWQVLVKVQMAALGMSRLSYASLLVLPHHQLCAAFNTLPCTYFTDIHRMALVWSRMDRRAHSAVRPIRVSSFFVCLAIS